MVALGFTGRGESGFVEGQLVEVDHALLVGRYNLILWNNY